jgi:hypothetical protein
MRLALVRTFLVAMSIAACALPLCAADDLDEFLSSGSVAATFDGNLVSPNAVPSVEGASAVNNADSATYAGRVEWRPALAAPAPHESLPDSGTALAHSRQPMPASGMSVVPEPSAVALAALALVYFLVFGRRTRWG